VLLPYNPQYSEELSTIIDWPSNGRKQALTTTKSNIFHPSLKNSWTLGVNEINLRQISKTKSPKIILSKERNIVPCSSEISGYESNPHPLRPIK
jgi:hypothetical protein